MLKAISDCSNEFLGTEGSKLQDSPFYWFCKRALAVTLPKHRRNSVHCAPARFSSLKYFTLGKTKGFPSNIAALDISVIDPDRFRTEIQQLAPLLAFQAIDLTQANSQLCCSQTFKCRSLLVLVLEEPRSYLRPLSQKTYASSTEEQQKQ